MNELGKKALTDALSIAENNLNFYRQRVTESQALVEVHREHVRASEERVAALKEAIEEQQ